jgi:hypothetical protein
MLYALFSRTTVDLRQEECVFIHLKGKKYCVELKNVVPLHRQKVNRLF